MNKNILNFQFINKNINEETNEDLFLFLIYHILNLFSCFFFPHLIVELYNYYQQRESYLS